jgi:hypothetical protein
MSSWMRGLYHNFFYVHLLTLIIIEHAANVCCVLRAANVFAKHRTQNSKIKDLIESWCSANKVFHKPLRYVGIATF